MQKLMFVLFVHGEFIYSFNFDVWKKKKSLGISVSGKHITITGFDIKGIFKFLTF